jgi:predicted component of type VI protein secretion system
MSVKLSIIRQPLGETEIEYQKVFGESGGTIGRAATNSWQLPDVERYVSSQHARIDCRDGNYYVIDTSTNGIYLNDAEEPLGMGNAAVLKAGDLIVIGDYEIRVDLGASSLDDSPFAGMTAEMKALEKECFLSQASSSQKLLQSEKHAEIHRKMMSDMVRIVFEQVVQSFAPSIIQERCDRSPVANASFSAPQKMQYWDAFVAMFQERAVLHAERYQRLCVDECLEVYKDTIMCLSDDD